MKHRSSVFLLLVLLAAGVARAQCPPSYIISAGGERDRPQARFTNLDLVKLSDGTSLKSLALRDKPGDATVKQWKISVADANALKQLRNQHGSDNFVS